MRNHRKEHVLIAVAVIFLIKLVFLLICEKEAIHLAINKWNGELRDHFFFWLTYAGDGLFALLAILTALFIRFRFAILLAISYVGSALIVQLMKHMLFAESMRPVRYFRDTGIDLHLVKGVDHHSYLSFPSGHSASAFAVFIVFALLSKNKYLAVFFVLIAALVAFSRVYLSQHFLADTLAGGFIGCLAAVLFYFWQLNWKKAWLDKSFLNLRN